MPFGVDDALAAGAGIAQGIGSAISGNKNTKAQQDMAAQNTMLQYIEWLRSQGLNEAEIAQNTQNYMAKTPLRDLLNYRMMGVAGRPAMSMTYTGNVSSPTTSAFDQSGYTNQQLAGYTPGAGGMDMSNNIGNRLLNSLGYGNDPTRTSMLDQHFRPKDRGETTSHYLGMALNWDLSGRPTGGQAVGRTQPVPSATPPAPARPAIPPGGGMPRQGFAPGGITVNNPATWMWGR